MRSYSLRLFLMDAGISITILGLLIFLKIKQPSAEVLTCLGILMYSCARIYCYLTELQKLPYKILLMDLTMGIGFVALSLFFFYGVQQPSLMIFAASTAVFLIIRVEYSATFKYRGHIPLRKHLFKFRKTIIRPKNRHNNKGQANTNSDDLSS
ncbi:hypothetical protein [Halodesulfovibrio aestuarii]|uniref:Uncharacterized protein n=1 Tax=Halodesulfovibrio aestuarii TaxID=126333 RepID=A0ABV4JWK4_9BACT